ncbi:MAG: glycosyltransferase family 4 protein [Alistipes sp.]|nr:glycosyltransferase family 4 protein [Alistipes sp.]
MKRVLLVTQYFHPEGFKSNDIAFELVKRGYKVDALVSIPNYPKGKYFDGYGLFKRRKEIVNGVNVYRAFQIPRGKGGLRLMLTYISYVISSVMWVLFFFAWRKKYDAIIVHQTSPIFQAIPAILLKKLRKTPVYTWVLDIWPDAMKSGGGIKNKKLLKAVDKVVVWVYKNSDKILISSKRFVESIYPKGNFEEKIVYFPNWSDDVLQMPDVEDKATLPKLPEGFKIMIAGNLGTAQSLDCVAEAMLHLKDVPEVKWVFVGDGSRKEWLEEFIKDNDLQQSAVCVGRFPASYMPYFYKQASAMLVTLRSGFPHLGMVVPARVQSYMSAGRPILGLAGSGVADLLAEANCGYSVPAGDAKALAELIRNQVLTDKVSFEAKGRNGREFYLAHFTKEHCIDNLCNIIE